MLHFKTLCLGATLMLAGLAATTVSAEETVIKKTLDGRCLTPDHEDYWETKVYVAKPSMEECLESGGRRD